MDELVTFLEAVILTGGVLAIWSMWNAQGSFDNSSIDLSTGTDNTMNNYDSLFQSVSDATGVPASLLSSVAFAESSYRADAIGPQTRYGRAEGLMQLMPRFYPGIDPLDPSQAVPAAANDLAKYYAKYGDWRLALAAYNWGPGNVDAVGANFSRVPPGTQAYANKILSRAGLA